MIAHYSQKISVGIALVCMVNHTAINQHKVAVDIQQTTQLDIDCPYAKNTIQIVILEKNSLSITEYKFLLIFFL